jgi:hypothetical protein
MSKEEGRKSKKERKARIEKTKGKNKNFHA